MPFTLKDVLDALNAGWPIALTLLIGSVAVLAGVHLEIPFATAVPVWAQALLFVTATFAAGSCLTRLLQAVLAGGRWLVNWNGRRKYRARQVQWLLSLPPDDHELMAYLFSERMQVFPYPFEEPRFTSLLQRGLVVAKSGNHFVESWPHLIPDHIWAVMQENPDRFRFDKRRDIPLRWIA